ncbi:MAG: hypothetical protein Kow0029_16570 [Candidatus Rifleibacteriota bacterium]
MQKMTAPDYINTLKRANAISAFLIFIFALAFRLFVLVKASHQLKFAYLVIFGSLAEIQVPLILLSIGIYARKMFFWLSSYMIMTFIHVFILLDFLHYDYFGIRINRDIFEPEAFKAWTSIAIFQFLAILAFVTVLQLFIIWASKQKTDVFLDSSRSNNSSNFNLLLVCTCIVLVVVSFRPSNPNSQVPDWDSYLATQTFSKKTHLHQGSLEAAWKFKLLDFSVNEFDLYRNSPFYKNNIINFRTFAQKIASESVFWPLKKVWSHRGAHSKLKENTSEAFLKAFKAGYPAIETDIFYYPPEKTLVLSHDPFSKESRAGLQTLDEALSVLSEKKVPYEAIWLDMKNLSPLNYRQIGRLIINIQTRFNLKDKLLVETIDPLISRKFAKAGIKTIWAVFYGQKNANFSENLHNYVKSCAIFSKCSAVSMPCEIVKQALPVISPFPIVTYTVNDREKIKSLAREPAIKVILTDLEDFYGEKANE